MTNKQVFLTLLLRGVGTVSPYPFPKLISDAINTVSCSNRGNCETETQLFNTTIEIATQEEEGDLIFYRNNSGLITCVEVYLGQGLVLCRENRSGLLIVALLGKRRRKIKGVRRIFNTRSLL